MIKISVIIPREYLIEIDALPYNNMIISVSGGVDSTAIALALVEIGYKPTIFWNNTLLSMQHARENIIKLITENKLTMHFSYPSIQLKELFKRTKKAVANIVINKEKYNKKKIPCCYYLKEKPFAEWVKKRSYPDSFFVSGIAPYEGYQRMLFTAKLRNRNTYVHFHRTKNRLFTYPLRDYTNNRDRIKLEKYLKKNGYKAKRSGCKTCPVVALFPKSEEDLQRIVNSKKIWLPKKNNITKYFVKETT